jgi:hypothetical protein
MPLLPTFGRHPLEERGDLETVIKTSTDVLTPPYYHTHMLPAATLYMLITSS